MWAAYTPEQLPHAVRDPANLAALKRALIDRKTPAAELEATDEEAARAQAFVDAVLWDLNGMQRRIDRLLAQRWLRVPLATVALIAVVVGLRALTAGENLAEGKPFRTSSTFSGWAACQADGACADLIFHTEEQMNPWVEYDLGAPKKIRGSRSRTGPNAATSAPSADGGGQHRSEQLDRGRSPRHRVLHLECGAFRPGPPATSGCGLPEPRRFT